VSLVFLLFSLALAPSSFAFTQAILSNDQLLSPHLPNYPNFHFCDAIFLTLLEDLHELKLLVFNQYLVLQPIIFKYA